HAASLRAPRAAAGCDPPRLRACARRESARALGRILRGDRAATGGGDDRGGGFGRRGARVSTHRVQTWVGRGLVAGILLGLLEAAERSYAVREFLQGPGERLAFAALAFAFCAMTGAAVGLTAGGITAVLDRAWRTALPRPLLRLVLGALIGVVGAAWLLYALTLTVRFDAIVRRSQQVLLVASALGALAGLAWPPVTNT